MQGKAYLRFVVLSVLLAVVLSISTLLLINRVSFQASASDRHRFLTFLAETLEARIGEQDIRELDNPLRDLRPAFRDGKSHLLPPPPPPPPLPSPLPPHPPREDGRRGGPKLWLVSGDGEMVFSSRDEKLPVPWEVLPKSEQVHDVVERTDVFRLFPTLHVVLLDYKEPLYLVWMDDRPRIFTSLLMTQAIIIFLAVTLGFVASFGFLFVYLRRKSLEARAVLRRLAQGDLKARFGLKRFDELGGLLVDFNHMADQIEKLVNRIHETEFARKNLVQELGHDLRTPLTALQAASETLLNLDGKMSETQRQELHLMIQDEVRYFGQLLENLMIIASLDEPQFKSSTVTIDLMEMLSRQVKRRQQSDSKSWKLELRGLDMARLPILGDPHLIERLLSNALSNADKFSKAAVEIMVTRRGPFYEVQIQDDGPGVDEATLGDFGLRRPFQNRRLQEGLHSSLGLGSVIMKSIAELHGGEIAIINRISEDGGTLGATLRIRLPALEQL